MISLIFKILADATGFNKTLRKDMPETARHAGKDAGKSAGASFGKEFGSQVKGAVMSVIGVTAIAAAIKKSVDEATQIAKDASTSGLSIEAQQELNRASEITGMSVSDIRKKATQAPEEFTALMAKVMGQGGFLDRNEVDQLRDVGSVFKSLGNIFTKGFSKVSSATIGGLTTVAANASTGLGEITGNQRFWRAGEMLSQMSDTAFSRLVGTPQDATKSSAIRTAEGDFLRKLDAINNTLKEKL